MKSTRNHSFQPKDARTFNMSYEDDEEEDDMSDSYASQGRMMTGTQALVEFLKTTSPEEFQRATPERSVNNLFSRIRKAKRNVSHVTPSTSTRSELGAAATTVPRKNYIEIVPQQKRMISRSAGNSRSPSFDTASFVLRKENAILPNKKRESSVFSGPASIKNNNGHPLRNSRVDAFLEQREGMDTIESALLQRLERLKTAHEETPSDKVAAGLATEHIRALGITHVLDNRIHENKSNVRHMQVQTEGDMSEQVHTPSSMQAMYTEDPKVRRAEAALENALDHFEVVSGLAYKKLRELWEEKMRWENACMVLRDRLLALEQKRQPTNVHEHGIGNLRGKYFPKEVEEEDELGMSEFPCSEN